MSFWLYVVVWSSPLVRSILSVVSVIVHGPDAEFSEIGTTGGDKMLIRFF